MASCESEYDHTNLNTYALQQILISRGYLDADGNKVPARMLAKTQRNRNEAEDSAEQVEKESYLVTPGQVYGKPCKECGATAVIKKDGCDFCTACGAVGSCG